MFIFMDMPEDVSHPDSLGSPSLKLLSESEREPSSVLSAILVNRAQYADMTGSYHRETSVLDSVLLAQQA